MRLALFVLLLSLSELLSDLLEARPDWKPLHGIEIIGGQGMPQPRKSRQKPQKSAKSRKSEAAKAVVLARSAAGASNSQIAREMGIDRETVSRILSEPEIAAVIQQAKNDVIRMVPKAVGVVDDALDEKNAKVAMSVLTGVGVLKPDGGYGGSGITLNITMDPRPRPVEIATIPRMNET